MRKGEKITAILNKMHKKPINYKRVERIMQKRRLLG